MATDDELLIFAIERTEVDTTGLIVLDVGKIARPVQEPFAVRKEDWPTVSLLILVADQEVLCDWSVATAIRVHTPQTATCVGRVQNDVLTSPVAATRCQNLSQRLRRAA